VTSSLRGDQQADGSFRLFVTFLQAHQPLFTAQDCCVTTVTTVTNHQHDPPPSNYTYELDLLVREKRVGTSSTTEDVVTQLQIAGPDARATAATLSGLLQWIHNNKKCSSTKKVDVTLRAFAKQPRQPLPPLIVLLPLHQQQLLDDNGGCIQCLRLHFVDVCSISDGWARLLSVVPELEFRQCTVPDWHSIFVPSFTTQKLTVSATLPEFAKLAAAAPSDCSLCNNSPSSSVQELSLVLHFWLQGAPMEAFCQSLLQSNRYQSLETLSIRYLDISDDSWSLLMRSLHRHPSLRILTLAFTDDFVDNYRRLTPERRRNRSRAVVDLLRANHPRLGVVTWPAFQQDEAVMAEIEELRSSSAGD